MRVEVDFDVCASTGSCMQICPEVFEVRSDGYLYILQEEPGEELRGKVTEAAVRPHGGGPGDPGNEVLPVSTPKREVSARRGCLPTPVAAYDVA